MNKGQTVIQITDGKVPDVIIQDNLIPEPIAYYIIDRGYNKFAWLYTLRQMRIAIIKKLDSSEY